MKSYNQRIRDKKLNARMKAREKSINQKEEECWGQFDVSSTLMNRLDFSVEKLKWSKKLWFCNRHYKRKSTHLAFWIHHTENDQSNKKNEKKKILLPTTNNEGCLFFYDSSGDDGPVYYDSSGNAKDDSLLLAADDCYL